MPGNMQPVAAVTLPLSHRTLKFGRRNPDPDRRRLFLSHYLHLRGDRALAPAPPEVDWTKGIPSFPMLDNDRLGNCVPVSAAHLEEVFTFFGTGTLSVATAEEVDAKYAKWCGPGDTGCQLEDVLVGWSKDGLAGDRLLAAAAVSPRDLDLARLCIQHFGGLFCGTSLPASALDEFDAGQPWHNLNDPPNPAYGHGFAAVKYNETGPVYATWGRLQQATWAWHYARVGGDQGESFVCITQAWLARTPSPSGIEVDALLKDWQALTGQRPPPKPNPPAPSPPPAPPPPAPKPPAPRAPGNFLFLEAGLPAGQYPLIATAPAPKGEGVRLNIPASVIQGRRVEQAAGLLAEAVRLLGPNGGEGAGGESSEAGQ